MANPLENDCKNANTHTHGGVTWWCWHIYKGDEVGVDVDRLGEEMEAKGETPPVECPPIECG